MPQEGDVLIYCLSKWFETNCNAEINFLEEFKILFFLFLKIIEELSLIKFIKSII